MDQKTLIAGAAAGLSNLPAVRALLVGGSIGRGDDDAFSDVDLIALVEPAEQAAVAAAWRSVLGGIAPVVFWNQRGEGRLLINAVTEEWLRCDLYLVPPGSFTGYAQDLVKPLIDRDGAYARLPKSLPPRLPDRQRVSFLIHEFIRCLGLAKIVVGRGKYFTAAGPGMGFMREHLVSLLLEEVAVPDRGGALHLSRLLPIEDMEMLNGLRFPEPKRAEVIAAHIEIARAFFPRARALAGKLGIEWPAAFEAATLNSLREAFGAEHDVSW